MISIDYKITFQDDLDSLEAYRKYNLSRTGVRGFIFSITAFMVLLGLFYLINGIIEYQDPDAIWSVIIGIAFIILSYIFSYILRPKFVRSNFNRRNLQKQWDKKPNQEEYRNIALTEAEIIFKTEFSESAWKWQAVKNHFEGNKSFILWFFSGDVIYIPKRIFEKPEEIEYFKNRATK